MDLNVIRTWHCTSNPGFVAYLLADGSILRPCTYPGGAFYGGGLGGRIQKYDADGDLVWDFLFSTYQYAQHHDVAGMPNGNVLLIAWERKTPQEVIAAGRVNTYGEMWPTAIFEVEPSGPTGGNVVWEWHLWDHLIQDADQTKENYGVVGDHPELMDVNLGEVSGIGGGDWDHANALDYHPELDQIVFSSHYLDEFYIIDHSTTTAEAAGHTGDLSGMGGDILYRWGNPQNYRAGDEGDRVFFIVHGANWIDPGSPGAGNILVFNNGDRPGVRERPLERRGDHPAAERLQLRSPGGTAVRAAGAHLALLRPGLVLLRPLVGSLPFSERQYPDHRGDERLRLRGDGGRAFELHQAGRVQVEIFDVSGRQVVTLIDRELPAGSHGAEWDGRDESGRDVGSGTYLVRLRVDESVEAERLVMLR